MILYYVLYNTYIWYIHYNKCTYLPQPLCILLFFQSWFWGGKHARDMIKGWSNWHTKFIEKPQVWSFSCSAVCQTMWNIHYHTHTHTGGCRSRGPCSLLAGWKIWSMWAWLANLIMSAQRLCLRASWRLIHCGEHVHCFGGLKKKFLTSIMGLEITSVASYQHHNCLH